MTTIGTTPVYVDIAEPGKYAEQLGLAHMVGQFILGMPLQEMVDAISLSESTGPILDPTAWIKNRDAMAVDKRILSALLGAQKELRKLQEERDR